MNPDDAALLRGHLRARLEVLGDEIRANALAQGLGVDKILRNAVAALENGRLSRAAALMDMVSVFLRGEAEHAAGAERDRKKRGGAKTAKTRKLEKEKRQAKVLAEAAKLRSTNPRLSNVRIAEILAERGGHGRGIHGIRKLLPKKR